MNTDPMSDFGPLWTIGHDCRSCRNDQSGMLHSFHKCSRTSPHQRSDWIGFAAHSIRYNLAALKIYRLSQSFLHWTSTWELKREGSKVQHPTNIKQRIEARHGTFLAPIVPSIT